MYVYITFQNFDVSWFYDYRLYIVWVSNTKINLFQDITFLCLYKKIKNDNSGNYMYWNT